MLKNPANGKIPDRASAADGERPAGVRHPVPQAAEPPHVDHAPHRVHHAARGEEQQRLEEGVREQVEHRRDDRELRHVADARPQGHEHVAELADGRIRQHPLQVGLRQGDRRREQRRQAADDARPELSTQGVSDDQRHRPGDQVDARRDHRRGVDQGRDGRRAFHRVGQPDVERDLGTLGRRRPEEQQRDPAATAACGIAARFAGAQDVVVAQVVVRRRPSTSRRSRSRSRSRRPG